MVPGELRGWSTEPIGKRAGGATGDLLRRWYEEGRQRMRTGPAPETGNGHATDSNDSDIPTDHPVGHA